MKIRISLFAWVLFAMSPIFDAPSLAVVVTKLYSIAVASAQLNEIDPATGATIASKSITLAGKTVTGGTGLAKDPTTGTLYALLKLSESSNCTLGGGGKKSELVTIDPSTGVANSIGNTGDCFAGITFSNNGTLYAVTGDGAETPETLYTLSKTTGALIPAKTLGNGNNGEAIAFNTNDGLIYHMSGNGGPPSEVLETVDPANFAAAPVNINLSGDGYIEALALTYQSGNVFLLTDGAANGAFVPHLFSITTGGVVTLLGTMDHASKGLAFVTTNVTPVNCSLGQTIQAAVNNAVPGETISVTGDCIENVLVRNEKQRIVLDGGKNANISGEDPNSPTVNIRGKGITLKGFGISGLGDGIQVNRGSNAVIDANDIATDGHGIVVYQLAFAVITNNNIKFNSGNGIFVKENSVARIGFNTGDELVASPNLITANSGAGIAVSQSSSARVTGNVISANSGSGVFVERDSQADIASNLIKVNSGDGVTVTENAMVNLGEDTGSTIFDLPNTTGVGNENSGFGFSCSEGSIAGGRQGTLTGTGGAASFDASCINDLSF